VGRRTLLEKRGRISFVWLLGGDVGVVVDYRLDWWLWGMVTVILWTIGLQQADGEGKHYHCFQSKSHAERPDQQQRDAEDEHFQCDCRDFNSFPQTPLKKHRSQ
jgi:hypothetical protein